MTGMRASKRSARSRLASGDSSSGSRSSAVKDAEAQRVHRLHPFGRSLEGNPRLVGKLAVGGQPAAELVDLISRWQRAVPEQMGDLLERGVAGQLFDVIAANGQLPLQAIDIAELCSGDDDSLQAARRRVRRRG